MTLRERIRRPLPSTTFLVNDAGDVSLHNAYLSMLLYKFPVFYFTFFQYFIYHFSNDRKREVVYRPKDTTLHLSPVSICGII